MNYHFKDNDFPIGGAKPVWFHGTSTSPEKRRAWFDECLFSAMRENPARYPRRPQERQPGRAPWKGGSEEDASIQSGEMAFKLTIHCEKTVKKPETIADLRRRIVIKANWEQEAKGKAEKSCELKTQSYLDAMHAAERAAWATYAAKKKE